MRGMISIKRLGLASAPLTLLAPSPAFAALPPIDAKAVIQAACQNNAGREISVERLGKMLFIATGHLPDEVLADPRNLMQQLKDVSGSSQHQISPIAQTSNLRSAELADLSGVLYYGIQDLEKYLDSKIVASDKDIGATIENAPSGRQWLFVTPGWKIKCDGDIKPPTNFVEDFRDADIYPQFVIRKSTEDFGKIGDDWKKEVGAFGIGLTRTRTILDDGSRKTDQSLKVDGAVGFRLSPPKTKTPSWLYASYSLNKDRTSPPPTLAPGAAQSDGDTNALELGFALAMGSTYSRPTADPESDRAINLDLTGSVSYIRDFAKKSSVGKFQYQVDLGLPVSLGICDVGKYEEIIDGIYTRCSLQVQAQAVDIWKGGEAVFKDVDQYLAAGGSVKIIAFAPTSTKDDGIVGSLSYRHLAVSSKSLDDIKRLDASLGYRLWITNGPGIDIGFSYNKGENDKSLEDEDILKFGIGLIF